MSKSFSHKTSAIILLFYISIFITFSQTHIKGDVFLPFLIIWGTLGVTPLISAKYFENRLLPIVLFIVSILAISHNVRIHDVFPFLGTRISVYLSNVTLTNHYWDPSYRLTKNSTIRVTILAPMISVITDLKITTLRRIIVPLTLSTIPIFMYYSLSHIYGKLESYFTAHLLVFGFTFFSGMIFHARQSTALLFLSIFLYCTFFTESWKKTSLILLSVVGMVFSHYGTTFVFLYAIVTYTILLAIVKKLPKRIFSPRIDRVISFRIIIFSLVFSIIWYMTTASGISFEYLVNISYSSYTQITSVFESQTRSTQRISQNYTSISILLVKYTYLFTVFIIGLGILAEFVRSALNKHRSAVSLYYLPLAISFSLLLIGALFPVSFGIFRIFIIVIMTSCIYIAYPFKIIGILSNNKYENPIVIFILIFFVVNSGLYSATISDDRARYELLDIQEDLETNDVAKLFYLHFQYESPTSAPATDWYLQNRDQSKSTFIPTLPDRPVSYLYISDYQGRKPIPYSEIQSLDSISGYLYTSSFFSQTGKLAIGDYTGSYYSTEFADESKVKVHNKIYSNGNQNWWININ